MGKNHQVIRDDAGPKARGTECAVPAGVVQALRYPEPTEVDFTPTRFNPASDPVLEVMARAVVCGSGERRGGA